MMYHRTDDTVEGHILVLRCMLHSSDLLVTDMNEEDTGLISRGWEDHYPLLTLVRDLLTTGRRVCVFYFHSKNVWTNLVGHTS